MAEITAKLVNELRAKTGQGMMECKKALQEVGGDMEKALDYFRKKGVKASLSERTATEGRVVGVAAQDAKAAALVEINCNTDFTAKSEPFLALGAKAAQALLRNPKIDIAQADTEIERELGVRPPARDEVAVGLLLELGRRRIGADVVVAEAEELHLGIEVVLGTEEDQSPVVEQVR